MTAGDRPRWRVLALLVAVCLVASSCSSDSPDSSAAPPDDRSADDRSTDLLDLDDPAFPGEDWERRAPEELGFDAEVLEGLADEAEAAGSDCFLVARNGRIAAEWSWDEDGPDTPREVFSVTKSITATLVGLAQDEGLLAIEDPASRYIPEWVGTPSEEVTVRDLLTNVSGRFWSLSTDYGEMVRTRDRTAYAIGLEQAGPPGDTWVYNNAAIQTLSAVLANATGMNPADYAAERLFDPIGMDDTSMTREADDEQQAIVFIGARTTCADLARLGHLVLQGGAWAGDQVVSADWIREATTSSTDLNVAYGYLWWLNRPGRIAGSAIAVSGRDDQEPTVGQFAPDAPEEVVWALGFGNQVLQLDPTTGTIVVRIGATSPPAGVDPFDRDDTVRVLTEALTS